MRKTLYICLFIAVSACSGSSDKKGTEEPKEEGPTISGSPCGAQEKAWQIVSKVNEAGEDQLNNFNRTMVAVYDCSGIFRILAYNGNVERVLGEGTWQLEGNRLIRVNNENMEQQTILRLSENELVVQYRVGADMITDTFAPH